MKTLNAQCSVLNRKKKDGFTLIEMLVSVGIVAVMAVVLSQALFTTTRSNVKVDLINLIKADGEFALAKIVLKIRGSDSIVNSCTTPVGSLTIIDSGQSMWTYSCESNSGVYRIWRQRTYSPGITGDKDYLTSINYTLPTCENLIFTCNTIGGVTKTVSITFMLVQKGTPSSNYERAGVPFATSVTLRN